MLFRNPCSLVQLRYIQCQSRYVKFGTWTFFGKFNVDKCKVVHYGRDSIGYKYSLYGQQLEEATSKKDLGIVFSKDLKVRKQCDDAYSKASQMLGLIHRIIQYKDRIVLVSLYKSMVRPHLENCSVVWTMEPALCKR